MSEPRPVRFGLLVCAAAALGLGVYFASKSFKGAKKLKPRSISEMPQRNAAPLDRDALNAYFVRELTLGQQLLQTGDESAVSHLVNAVRVFNDKHGLLEIIRAKCSAPMFEEILHELGYSTA